MKFLNSDTAIEEADEDEEMSYQEMSLDEKYEANIKVAEVLSRQTTDTLRIPITRPAIAKDIAPQEQIAALRERIERILDLEAFEARSSVIKHKKTAYEKMEISRNMADIMAIFDRMGLDSDIASAHAERIGVPLLKYYLDTIDLCFDDDGFPSAQGGWTPGPLCWRVTLGH